MASANDELRLALRRAVDVDDRFGSIDEVTTLAKAAERVARAPFLDLVVLDRLLPDLEGGDGLRDLAGSSPSSAVVIHPGRRSATASGTSDPPSFVAAIGGDAMPGGRRTQTLTYPGTPTPAEARRFVAEACEKAGAKAITDSAELVTDELLTNAVRHATTPIGLHLEVAPATVRIDVRDATATAPLLPDPRPDAVSGRGLRLVGAFAMAWGFHHVIGGKAVWAVLSRPSGPGDGVGRMLV